MSKLLINRQTQMMVDRFTDSPSHALLLTGEIGVGLLAIADELAHKLTAPSYITHVAPENGTLSIDEIRPLYALTKTKQADRQVIIIDDADAMRHEAQNALLKLLEEPSTNVIFILTTHRDQLLLATIHSRVQKIMVRPISAKASQDFVEKFDIKDETKARQILFIAGGRPAEIYRLAHDEKHFLSQSTKATDARAFHGSDT